MAINFTNLFTKIGHLGNLLNVINASRGTTVPGDVNTLYSSYTSTSDEATIDGFQQTLASWQNSNGSFLSSLQSLATSTIINTVNADVSLPDRSLPSAMGELIVQMKAGSQTVQQSVVSVSGTASGTNEGNPAFVLSNKTSDGLILENTFAETITGSCTTDSQSGARAGSEIITYLGQYPTNDVLSWTYPLGSACSLSLTVVDASLTSSSGYSQNLSNGDFEAFTVANVPDEWHITVGTAGTQIVSSVVAYTGIHSLGIVGDGSTLTSIQQQFSIDNNAVLNPLTQYAVNFWLKANTVPAAGALQVALVDGTGTVIDDEQGTANSFTIDLTTISTTFTAHGGSFRLPRLLPTSIYLRLHLTTAISSGSTIYLDRLGFAQMLPFYQGGPYIAGFSGNLSLLNGDSFTVTVTNTAGGFQRLFQRFFNMSTLRYLLPSTTGTPTLPDTLIS